MYIVTTLSYDELGHLIKDKQVSLDNGRLFFGADVDVINNYFKDRIGSSGYVVGLYGRLNNTTAQLFSSIDKTIKTGGRVILEAEVDDRDALGYTVDGVELAAQALAYGFPEEEIYEHLDDAIQSRADEMGVGIVCVPAIKANGKVRVTSLVEDLAFNVEGITFVKLKTGGN